MRPLVVTIVFGLMTSAASASSANAETILPRAIKYDFEEKHNAGATTCNLMLMLLNYPAPETVNFRLITAANRQNGPLFVGFSMDVGDTEFKNGVPVGIRKVGLTEAAFSSSSFSSQGLLNSTLASDGGILASTTDGNDGGRFINAFVAGNFTISFRRNDAEETRAYRINEGPSREVFDKFRFCTKSLGPEDG